MDIDQKKMAPKEFLLQYRKINSEIDKKIDEISTLRAHMTKTTQDPSTEHVKSSTDPDKLTGLIFKIDEAEHQADELIDQLCNIGTDIQRALVHVENKQAREVLTLIYIANCSFEFVAVKMGITHRWATELHGYGLGDIKKYLTS